mmetsp:Transcript_53718/g.120247  ORF Transcript_53718/g.120247 Transcript_53718/m.120247 type:complete len:93 (+) Transcript_53718:66-344(+)
MGSAWACCELPHHVASENEELIHPEGPPRSFRPLAGASALSGAVADAVAGAARSVAETLMKQRPKSALEDSTLSPTSREPADDDRVELVHGD